MKFYLGILLGAAMIYLWGFVIWTIVLMRADLVRPMAANSPVVQAIVNSKMNSGLYQYPWTDAATHKAGDAATMKELEENSTKGPIVRLQVSPGMSMADPNLLILGFLHMLLSAAILATLTRCLLSWASFGARYGFIVAVAVFAAIWIDLSNSIWMLVPWSMSLFTAGYNIGAWILAGIPLAWGTKGNIAV